MRRNARANKNIRQPEKSQQLEKFQLGEECFDKNYGVLKIMVSIYQDFEEERHWLGILTGFIGFQPEEIEDLNEGIDFGENLKLRLLSQEEENRLLREPNRRWGNFEYIAFEIETKVNLLDNRPGIFQLGTSAFRLHKKGDIFLQGIAMRELSKTNSIWQYTTPMPRVQSGYYLNEEDILPVKDIFLHLRRIDFQDSESYWLNICLDRFDRYFQNYRASDKLIDIMIAYEALFLRGSRFRVKRKEIARKCSKLIGNGENKDKIKDKINRGYLLRNDVVHSSKYNENEIWALLRKLEDYLRQSILKTISTI